MTFDTPFGPVDSVQKPLAPTKKEVAENPSFYLESSFDPFKLIVPQGIFQNFSDDPDCVGWVLPTLNDWFLKEKSSALKYFKNQFGYDLNVANLPDKKKKELGF